MIENSKLNIFLRYLTLLILNLIINSKPIITSITFIFTTLLSTLPNLEKVSLNTVLLNSSTQFIIIRECIAPSAYILGAIILLTMPLPFKKSISLYLKFFLTFTILNFLRILFLILIYNYLSFDIYNSIHALFYHLISGIVVGIILLQLIKKENLKNQYPIITDIKTILKN